MTMKTSDDYTNRVTSEHIAQPNYLATIRALVVPLSDMQLEVEKQPEQFDIDFAIGVQLDAVGVRLNRDRFISVPLNIYFSVEIAGLGVNQGYLKGPYDPDTGQAILPDEAYRVVLYATVAANEWDGTIPAAYAAYDIIFESEQLGGSDAIILIQDYGNLSFALAMIGPKPPDALTTALFTTEELDLKPAAIKLYHLMPVTYPSGVDLPNSNPVFGVGVHNYRIAGIGWGHIIKTISVE